MSDPTAVLVAERDDALRNELIASSRPTGSMPSGP
jgi:hypothetical protein